MTLSVFKNGDVLYTIIFRNPEAKFLLQKWMTTNRHAQARVEENKLHIYDHNTLNIFSLCPVLENIRIFWIFVLK